jgi:hypothetical protein
MRVRTLLFISFLSFLLLPVAPALGAVQPEATVTIVHGLPGFTADIYVNGKLVLNGFKPTSEAGPLKLPSGTYHIDIRNVGSSSSSEAALSKTVSLAGGQSYTLVAHLTSKGDAALSVYRNDQTAIAPGRCRLIIRPAAALPPIALMANGASLFTDVPLGQEKSTEVAPGDYALRLFAKGDSGPILPVQHLNVREGTAYALYVVGSGTDKSLDLMVQSLGDLSSSPSGVQSGTGGLAAPTGVPGWRWAAVVMVGILLATAGLALRQRTLFR